MANEIHKYRDVYNPETPTPEVCLDTILSRMVEEREFRIDKMMESIFERKVPITQVEYDIFLFSAALRTNSFGIVQRIIRSLPQPLLPLSVGWLRYNLGIIDHAKLAATYCNKEIIELLLTAGEPVVNRGLRTELFQHAAAAGRLETLKFVYTFKKEEVPWKFVDPVQKVYWSTQLYEDTVLYWSLNTPNLGVAKFIEELRSKNSNSLIVQHLSHDQYRREFTRAAAVGCVETAKFLIELGADPQGNEGFVRHTNDPVIEAAESGHEELVEFLVASSEFNYEKPWNNPGANPRAALAGAARTGRTELVRRLLKLPNIIPLKEKYEAHTKFNEFGCLYEAAKLGYLGVVQLLLDSGVNANTKGGRFWEYPLVGRNLCGTCSHVQTSHRARRRPGYGSRVVRQTSEEIWAEINARTPQRIRG